jgi:hypothetical protein
LNADRAPQLKALVRCFLDNMKLLFRAGLLILLITFASDSSEAKEWRGLVPLRSTRADVIRLMNQCADQREACRFTLKNEKIYIRFSGGLANEYAECAARLPAETIMFIQIEPDLPPKFKDLHLDKKSFQSFNTASPFKQRFTGYRNREGLVILARKERILRLDYLPDESDRYLCSLYYEEPESFVEVVANHYDNMYVDGPDSARAGESLTLFAHTNINDKCGYTWTLSAGKILSGQYTQQVTVDTTGLAGQKIKITAEIGDGFGHQMFSSRTVEILAN